jgi:hypothetical protein
VRDQTPQEEEREREEDERNAGCFLFGLGCAADAFFALGLPIAFVWLLS